MKNGTKRFILSFLILTLTCSSALAQEKLSWFQKIKNFFKGETAGQETSEVITSVEQTKSPVEEKKQPVFDFSEKTIGDRSAPIKINIFTSLTCTHCPIVHSQIMPHLEKNYVQKNEAILILSDFPLDNRAVTASLISRCLSGDKYFAFIETLFENQSHWAFAPNLQEALLPYVKLAGMSEEEMIACATNEDALKEVARQRNLALLRYKIHATPTLILQLGKETKKFEGVPHQADLDKAIEELKKTYKGPWPLPSDGDAKEAEKAAP